MSDPGRFLDAASSPYGPAWTTAAAPRERRAWDVALTVILLIIGLFSTLFSLAVAALLPEAVTGAVPAEVLAGDQLVLVISHLLLYGLAVAVSIILIALKRIAFWVPLVAGAIAVIVFWTTIVGVILLDAGI